MIAGERVGDAIDVVRVPCTLTMNVPPGSMVNSDGAK